MGSMFELTNDYKRLLMMLEDAEDADDETMQEVIKDTLELLDGDIEAKADQIAYIIRELDGDEEILKKEEQRIKAKHESIVKNRQRLKDYLMEAMRLTGKEKFKTALNSFGIRKAGGKQPLIIDFENPADIPEDYRKVVKYGANSDKIREALDKGEELSWARYAERTEYLSIR